MKLFLEGFFQEDNGKSSSKRLLFIVTIFVMLGITIFVVLTQGFNEIVKTFAEFLVSIVAAAYGVVASVNKISDSASGNNPPAKDDSPPAQPTTQT